MQVTDVRDVIIIGSGPAGYTAAIYAARAKLQPLVFEGSVTAGGALMQTTDVENFPGFPDGIMGPELMDALRKQAERFGAELVSDDVVEVDLTVSPKVVKTETDTYLAKAVIIATGSKYKELGVPGEKELSGHGVSWCATCDGFFFREQDIAVIGGGDSALEEALFLTRFGKSVTLVHRRDTLRASKIMQDRAFANPKIKFQWDSEVVSMEGDRQAHRRSGSGTSTAARRRCCRSAACSSRSATRRAASCSPASSPPTPTATWRSSGRSTRTAIEGVFACGDVVDHVYRQAITAAGSGCCGRDRRGALAGRARDANASSDTVIQHGRCDQRWVRPRPSPTRPSRRRS